MNHWSLFRQSWTIFWRNPALWLFGLLAALGGGVNLNYSFNISDLRRVNAMPFEARALLSQFLRDSGLMNSLSVVLVIGIVWAVLAFLLATFAQSALISMVGSIDSGQKPGVSAGFRAGGRRFLPLLAVRFLLALPILIIALIAAGTFASSFADLLNEPSQPAFNFQQFGAIAGLGTLGFLVGLLMTAIGVSAERAVVLEETTIGQSLAQGWKMLWSKLGDYVVIALILLGIGIVAGLVFACILLPIICGSIFLGVGQALSAQRNPLVFVTTLVGPTAIIAVLLGLLFGILATVFVSSVWTLAYRRWRGTEPQPAASALQPVAPIEPIPPIEPLKPTDAGGTPSSNEPPQGN